MLSSCRASQYPSSQYQSKDTSGGRHAAMRPVNKQARVGSPCSWPSVCRQSGQQFSAAMSMSMTRTAAQQTTAVQPMLVWRWSTVCDGGPTLNRHWWNVPGWLADWQSALAGWLHGWLPANRTAVQSNCWQDDSGYWCRDWYCVGPTTCCSSPRSNKCQETS